MTRGGGVRLVVALSRCCIIAVQAVQAVQAMQAVQAVQAVQAGGAAGSSLYERSEPTR